MGGITAGSLIAGFLVWLVWRHKPVVKPTGRPAGPPPPILRSTRGEPPTPTELMGWQIDRVREVAAALFETEGFRVELRSKGGDVDLALRRGSEVSPSVLVCCRHAGSGLVQGRPVRELLAAVAVEGAQQGWCLSPGGFSLEAREFSRDHGIVLLGAEELIERLRALPPLAMASVVSRGT
jgi:hypothetical protein